MTTIAAVYRDGVAWIGTDSLSTTSLGERIPSCSPKLYRQGAYLFGVSGQRRVSDVVGRAVASYVPDATYPDGFVDHLRAVMKTMGVCQEKDGEFFDGNILLAAPSGLCQVDVGFGINVLRRPYYAAGAGGAEARGALYTLQDSDDPPAEQVHRALEAASALDVYTGPPFIIWSTDVVE